MKTLWSISTWSILLLASTSFAIESEQITYYHNDALGSPIAATDSNGNLVWREEYSPFGSRLLRESRETDCESGNCIPVESIWDEKQWYTGKMEETRIGLQYFGARWYEPETGRFLSADPVNFNEQNIFTVNRYLYANNNPYKYVDPDGREATQVGFSIRLPKVLGLAQRALGRDIKVNGFDFGIAWSSPNAQGEGEYDIGIYLSSQLNGGGLDTGRLAMTYAVSVDDAATLQDLAGVGGSTSINLWSGGLDVSYSENGIEMTGLHIGPGIGVTAQAEATSLYTKKHGKVGWYKDRVPTDTTRRKTIPGDE